MKGYKKLVLFIVLSMLLSFEFVKMDVCAEPTSLSYDSIGSAGTYLREQMVNRNERIEVKYETSEPIASEEILGRDIYDEALKYTGKGTEGDYIAFQTQEVNYTVEEDNNDTTYIYTITYTLQYYTSSVQEEELSEALTIVLNQLCLHDNDSDYQKVLSIYNYVCETVTYDYVHLNDEQYNLKYTAYAALKNKTAVCNGYALLMYRLLLESGLEARIIEGPANGDNHAWNIVRIDDVYYCLDSTWDSENYTCIANTRYFLKGETSFSSDHTRKDSRYQYTSDEYNAQFPVSENDYLIDRESVLLKTDEDSSLGIKYNEYTDYVAITGVLDGVIDLNVPEYVNGKKVRVFNSASQQDSLQSIILPDSVSSIGGYAFCECKNLKSIVLSNKLVEIPTAAFSDCVKLESITIPNSVCSIQASAFSDCDSLKEIDIHPGVREIIADAFIDCDSLGAINVDENNVYYYSDDGLLCEYAHHYLVSVPGAKTSVIVPQEIVVIENYAFIGCRKLTDISFPSSIQSIDGYFGTSNKSESAYANCISLTNVSFYGGQSNYSVYNSCIYTYGFSSLILAPGGLEEIRIPAQTKDVSRITAREDTCCKRIIVDGDNTCYCSVDGVLYDKNISNLICAPSLIESIDIPEGVTTISEAAFNYCRFLENISFPSTLEAIERSAFNHCGKLDNVHLNRGLVSLGSTCFHYCVSLSKISLPPTLTTIDYMAFKDCPELAYIYLPNSVTSIGRYAFGMLHLFGNRSYTNTSFIVYCDKDSALYNRFINSGFVWKDTSEYPDEIDHDHDWDEGVVTSDSTGEEDNVIIYTCRLCHHTKTSVIEDAVGEQLAGHSLSLEGDIGINFFMELNDTILADDDAFLRFTLPDGKVQDVYIYPKGNRPVASIDTTTVPGKTMYRFQCGVAAKEMRDSVYAQMYLSSGETGKKHSYTVKQYADYMKKHLEENESYQKAYGLICSMLNYGSYAQTYFGNHVESLANLDSLTDEQLSEFNAVSEESINRPYDKSTESLPQNVSFMGASLELESETELNLYFWNAGNANLTFEHKGVVLGQKMSGDYIQVTVKGIAAQNLNDDFEVKLLVDGSEECYSVRYSPMHYCYNVLSRERPEELKNLIKALFIYNQKAIEYFREN